MITNTQRRNKIIKRISGIPEDKLQELDNYISKLEKETETENRALSLAGAWQDIENSLFTDLTKNLIRNRQKSKRRINE